MEVPIKGANSCEPEPNNDLLQEFDLGMRFAEAQWDEPSLAQGRPSDSAKPMVQMQSYAKLCVARRQACDQLWDPGASNAAGCCHVGMKGRPHNAGLCQDQCKFKAYL